MPTRQARLGKRQPNIVVVPLGAGSTAQSGHAPALPPQSVVLFCKNCIYSAKK